MNRWCRRRDDEGDRKSRNPLTEPQLELSLGSTSRGKLTSPSDTPLFAVREQRAGLHYRGAMPGIPDEEALWVSRMYAHLRGEELWLDPE